MNQYYLKYFAEIQNFRGQLTRVEIHQRDTAPDAVLQIGDVCGLELEIQGNTEDIFVPIIKTQARLSMVSSDDKPTSGGIKYGDWGEFYTPDASLYKFVLKTKPTAEASDWTTRWTGYITPDSWQEGLDYRSAITIIARDNIGHLQDFDFDMQPADKFGLASIRSILAAAMEKIDFPMDYITDSAPESIQADGTDILDALVLLSNFEGDNWYSVVEDILDSIGYTLRYTDNNRFTLAPVRYLPLLGEASESAQRENADLEFFGGTGEIVPAVKKIVEEVNYDYESEVPLRINAEHLWTAEKTYHCIVSSSVTGIRPPLIDSQNAKYRNLTTNDWTVWKAGSSGNDVADLWKPGKPSIVTLTIEGENWNNYVFLAANGVESDRRTQAMKFKSATSDLTIRFYFHRHPVSILEDPTQTQLNGAVVLGDIFGRAGLAEVEYIVKITDGSGIIRFWNDKTKEWGDTSVTNEQEYEPENLTTDVSFILGRCPDITGECTIEFTFVHIAYMLTTPLYVLYLNGCYARLSNVTIESNAVNLKSNTIRTINDEKYNVLINRKPSVAPLSRQVSYTHPANYPSALFYLSGSDYLPKPFPYEGNWSNISRVTKPLPVLIHQQLLCYRGANLWQVSGECAPKERRLLYFDTIVRYKNRRYIIQAGTMDFMTGTFVSATLREFLEYDDIWDDSQQGEWNDLSRFNTIGGEVSSSRGGAGSTGWYTGSGKNFFEEDGDGGVKLKDEYNGLWAKGYGSFGGIGHGDPGGGGDLLSVWTSLHNNNDDYANWLINARHIPLGSGLTYETIDGYEYLKAVGGVESVVGLTGAITRQQLNSQIATNAITSGSDMLATSGAVYSYVNTVLSSAIKFKGLTTTELVDGGTNPAIVVDGKSYTAIAGDVVVDGRGFEFLWTGSKWQKLGDDTSYALKTISITGTGYLSGGGTLDANRTIDLTQEAKTKLEAGATVAGFFANGILDKSHLPSMYIGRTAVAFSPANTTLLGINAISNLASSDSSDKSRIEWDETNNAWHFYGNVYADGWGAFGGVGSGGSGGGGIVERIHRYSELGGTFSQTANDVFDAYTVNQLHLRIRALEQSPGGVTSVAGILPVGGDVKTSPLQDALGIDILGSAVQSLQSQIDSVSARNNYDELTATVFFADIITGSSAFFESIEGTLNGNATTASRLVNSSFAVGSGLNPIYFSGGLPVASTSTMGSASIPVWFNKGVITECTPSSLFSELSSTKETNLAIAVAGNRITTDLYAKYDGEGEIIADKFGVIADSLQSLQSQMDSLASRDKFDELAASVFFADTAAVTSLHSQTISLGGMLSDFTPSILEWDESNKAWKLTGNFYATGFVAAGGVGSSGGGSTDLLSVWASFVGNNDEYAGWNINPGHLPSIVITGNGITGNGSYSYNDTTRIATETLNLTLVATGVAAGTYRSVTVDAYGRVLQGTNPTTIAGYGITDAYTKTEVDAMISGIDLPAVSEALQSLQSQVDSVAAKDSYDSLSATELFADVLTASNAYIETVMLGGNALSNSGGVIKWNGVSMLSSLSSSGATITAVVGGQSLSTTITSIPNSSLSNSAITVNGTSVSLGGSVRTATISAGTAGQSTQTSGVEFYIPYVTVNQYGIVTDYGVHYHWINQSHIFGSSAIGSAGLPVWYNGSSLVACTASSLFPAPSSTAGTNLSISVAGQTRTLTLYATYDSDSENIADKFGIVSTCLKSLQSQIDSVASKTEYDELAATMLYSDTLSVGAQIEAGGTIHSLTGVWSEGYITAGGIASSSDRRMKDEIEDVCSDRALSVLMQLRPKEWVWNDKNGYFSGKRGAGLVAQDVEAVLPFAVMDSGDYLSLNYTVLHAYEIAGLQNHEKRIADLEKENAELRRRLETINI